MSLFDGLPMREGRCWICLGSGKNIHGAECPICTGSGEVFIIAKPKAIDIETATRELNRIISRVMRRPNDPPTLDFYTPIVNAGKVTQDHLFNSGPPLEMPLTVQWPDPPSLSVLGFKFPKTEEGDGGIQGDTTDTDPKL